MQERSERRHWWAFLHQEGCLPASPLALGFLFTMESRKEAFRWLSVPLGWEGSPCALGIPKWAVVTKTYFQTRPVKLEQGTVFQDVHRVRKKAWVLSSRGCQCRLCICFCLQDSPLLCHSKHWAKDPSGPQSKTFTSCSCSLLFLTRELPHLPLKVPLLLTAGGERAGRQLS